MSDTTQTQPAASGRQVDKVVVLPSERTATIYKTKGRDIREAQRRSQGDDSMFMNCLMSVAVEIDGAFMLPEDFDEIDGKDYINLLTEVSGNFTPSVPKT